MSPTTRHLTGRHQSERWFDGAVATYAVWTLLCVVSIGFSRSLHQLVLVTGLAAVVGAGVCFAARFGWRRGHRKAGPAKTRAPSWGTHERLGLTILVVAGAVITLCVHRSDLDDAFYIGVAKWHALRPHIPILRFDLMHGIADAPLASPAYAFHSLEILFSAITYTTGISAIYAAHLVVAPLAGAGLVFAQTTLARALGLRRWLWIGCLLIATLLLLGEPHRFHSNFAFVRLYQGKAILLSVLLPWITVCGFRYADQPTASRWARLAIAQVASVGLSSTAILLSPLVGGVALLSVVDWRRRDARFLRVLAGGAAASIYPLAVGVFLWLGTDVIQAQADELQSVAASSAQTAAPQPAGSVPSAAVAPSGTAASGAASDEAPRIRERDFSPGMTLDLVLGRGALRWWILGVLIAAILGTQGRSRRYWLLSGGMALILLVPPIHRIISALIGSSHWRTLWVLPIPLLVAVALDAAGFGLTKIGPHRPANPLSLRALVLRAVGARTDLGRMWLLRLIPVVAFFLAVPTATIFTARHLPASWNVPNLKVSPEWWLVADLVEAVASGAAHASGTSEHPGTGTSSWILSATGSDESETTPVILLPTGYTGWVSTAPRAAVVPLVVRPQYLDLLEGSLSTAEIRRRKRLHRWISGRAPAQPEAAARAARNLRRAIETYDLAAVGWKANSGCDRWLDMEELGYALWHEDEMVRIWIQRR